MNMLEKKCSKCFRILSINNFRKDTSKSTGYYSSCNDCYRKKYGQIKRTNLGYWRDIPIFKSGKYLCVNGKRIHIIVAEEKLGRKLFKDEVIHHLDGNKYNNDPQNIEVLNRIEHLRFHSNLRIKKISEQDKKKIIELYNSGIGTFRLSHMFNLSKATILKRLHKWKVLVRCIYCHISIEGNNEKTEEMFNKYRPQ